MTDHNQFLTAAKQSQEAVKLIDHKAATVRGKVQSKLSLQLVPITSGLSCKELTASRLIDSYLEIN